MVEQPATRPLGMTSLRVTPVAMGCWPIAGVTSINVSRENSLATLHAALDHGINFFDTAYCYGYAGESEQMVGEVLAPHRDRVVIATKGGIHWGADKQQVRDAAPTTIRRECEESLRRLKMDVIDLYYLHGPDPARPIAESAGAFLELLQAGKIRSVGVSNFNAAQLAEFHRVCPIAAFQPRYNMIQREIEVDTLPWCIQHNVSVFVYWPLMKGLLAGKLPRNHVFDPRDGRQKLPIFQGEDWERTHDLLDVLRRIASEAGMTVSQLVINWTIQQPGITGALCGAKRPDQIIENAAAMNYRLSSQQLAEIDAAIAVRRAPASTGAAEG